MDYIRMRNLILLAGLMALIAITPSQAKGGHGHGHAYFGAFYSSPPGWSHGRKVGWRGFGCPPGLAKQGRC